MAKSEADAAEILAKTGLPVTGSNAKALLLTNNKIAVKKILSAGNLPVPQSSLNFPVILKPATQHCQKPTGLSSSTKVFTKSLFRRNFSRRIYQWPGVKCYRFRRSSFTYFGNSFWPFF